MCSREKDMDSHIVCIEKFSKDSNGEQKLHGCWFLRPGETYHVATRKFLQKEVFKSDFNDSVPFSKVLGKCYIMFVKDYFKMKPEVRIIINKGRQSSLNTGWLTFEMPSVSDKIF